MDINVMLGELMNSPAIWGLATIGVVLFVFWRYGIFKKIWGDKEAFKGEPLSETLLKDLRPRLRKHGKRGKGSILMQHYHPFGKVRKWCEGEFEFMRRKAVGNPDPKEKAELEKVKLNVVYFLVGGNALLAWIPFIGKNYQPDYYILKNEYVNYDPKSNIYEIDATIHLFPYAEVWVSDKQTAKYLTELEARRTQEFEAETNINTLKRWTYYDSQKAGRVTLMEKETDLEKEKWDNTREEWKD